MSKCDMWRFSVKIFIVLCKREEIGDEESQVTKTHAVSFTPKETPAASMAKVTDEGFSVLGTFPFHRSGLNFIIMDSTNVLFRVQLSRLVNSLWSLQPPLQYLQSKSPFYLSLEDIRLWQLRNVILKARTFHMKRNPSPAILQMQISLTRKPWAWCSKNVSEITWSSF